MQSTRPLTATILLKISILTCFALAQENELSLESSRNKSQYHLFNPAPRSLVRDLSPDRPDATESPITIDAGHAAIEVSLFDWRREGGDDSYTLMSTNIKLGLTNQSDLQFVFDSYTWQNSDSGQSAQGFGDVQIRLKYNLWGNDKGDTALALFPYVKIPTGTELSNEEWEAGLIIPFSAQVTQSVSLGLMAELDLVYDEQSQGHEVEFLHSAVLGIDLTENWGAFVEYIGISTNSAYEAYSAGGFTYAMSEDFVFDLGAQFGLNGEAEDLGAFIGFTKRF